MSKGARSYMELADGFMILVILTAEVLTNSNITASVETKQVLLVQLRTG